jgi:hypothetical protein
MRRLFPNAGADEKLGIFLLGLTSDDFTCQGPESAATQLVK